MVMTSSALGYDTPTPAPVEEEAAPSVAEQSSIPTSGKFDVLDIEELEDGSLNMVVNMDFETLRLFAKVGMMKVLEDAANKVIAEHGSA